MKNNMLQIPLYTDTELKSINHYMITQMSRNFKSLSAISSKKNYMLNQINTKTKCHLFSIENQLNSFATGKPLKNLES